MTTIAAARPAAPSNATSVLFGLLAVFQIADYLTTNYALSNCALGEANVVMAWCFSSLGILGLAFAKVVLLGFTALAVRSIPRWSLALMVLISGIAAGSNIFHVAPILLA